ncbi:MAG TPA: 4-hydroxythreonine-4-phosphate dehydrogenase PdxA [Thermoanaerobaculia bacterium]|nr:4-hydroxythreonine-4-phosphate dehydrogenase PdxA [Thermoanaerobaculia bacterium]
MKPIAVTLGDPAGIGPEVVLKAVAGLEVPVWLFGSRRAAEQSASIPPGSRFHDVGAHPAPIRFGEISSEHGRIALASIDQAVEAVERGDCCALVTAPIHKQAMAAAGSPFPGHTELLAARAGLTHYGREFAMYFDSPAIRTVLLTVHVPLREALTAINASAIADLALLTRAGYQRLYGSAPRIAVAAVNPHAGEGGRFGSEEEEIARGVEQAARHGIDISGPHPADTLFLAAREGKYDVVMAMYHDQGLIPVKTLAFETSVNVTLGLPYLRASVDHGTAFDIAGKGVADARPMRYAIEWTARHAERWSR